MQSVIVRMAIATTFFMISAVHAASLPKARALLDNGLHDEAKKELIDVLYASGTNPDEKATALYLLGIINMQQGNGELANKNWQDLVDRYPKSTESELVRQRARSSVGNASTSSQVGLPEPVLAKTVPVSSGLPSASRPLSTGVRLLNAGESPRFLLRYSPSMLPEQARTVVRMVTLDGDCPAKASAEKYPSMDVDVATRIQTEQEDTLGVVKVHVTHQMRLKLADGSVESKALEDTIRFTELGKILETSSGDMEPFGAGFTQFPVEAVGQGATWESSLPAGLLKGVIKDGVIAKATYTVAAIASDAATLLVKFSADAKFEEGGQVGRVEVGGDGTLIWNAGRLMPPGSSGILSLRMSEEGAPKETMCALITYETKRWQKDDGKNVSKAEQSDGVVKLVDESDLPNYWRVDSASTPELKVPMAIKSNFCAAFVFSIGKDGVPSNVRLLHMIVGRMSKTLEKKLEDAGRGFVEAFRFVPAPGEHGGTPVFTYASFGQYSAPFPNDVREKARRGGNVVEPCREAARSIMWKLYAK